MAHSHHSGSGEQVELGVRRRLALAAALLAAGTAVALVLMWPSRPDPDQLSLLGFSGEVYDAKVVNLEVTPCRGTDEDAGVSCQRVHLELLEGPDRGDRTFIEFPSDDATAPEVGRGDRLALNHNPESDLEFRYTFADRARLPVLGLLGVAFAAAVVLLGRMKGVAALAGLAGSFVILLGFVLPAVVDGADPVMVAVVGASSVAFLALYLAHGFGPMTHVALLGTLGSLVLTVILARIFVTAARFSGLASEEAAFLSVAGGSIDVGGLVLGGIVIGALGAIDDMTVTQASVVSELRAADPTMSARSLLAAGLRIGRDHVASTVNTLALAYAGASLPLLVLFVLSSQSLGTIVNSEVIAVEVVRTLVGSIGLVASVPLTTWLAVKALGPPHDSARELPLDPEVRSS